MATSYAIVTQPPVTYTYYQYTMTTITASPLPSLAATITLAASGPFNGSTTTTSEVLVCTPSCLLKDTDGECKSTQECRLSDFTATGFVKQGENGTATKTSGALRLWRDPGARMAVAVLGVSWVFGVAMLKAF